MPYRPSRHDPLARATRTQRAGRQMVAIAIVTFLLLTPTVFELVDRLAPGWLPAWIGLVLLAAIAGIARTAERAPEPAATDRTTEPPA